jgi:hypothetical protein
MAGPTDRRQATALLQRLLHATHFSGIRALVVIGPTQRSTAADLLLDCARPLVGVCSQSGLCLLTYELMTKGRNYDRIYLSAFASAG